MPVVLIPIHFDRDPQQRPVVPSCQRSVVIRTFITSDFMTGIPATPGREIPEEVGGAGGGRVLQSQSQIGLGMRHVDYRKCFVFSDRLALLSVSPHTKGRRLLIRLLMINVGCFLH